MGRRLRSLTRGTQAQLLPQELAATAHGAQPAGQARQGAYWALTPEVPKKSQKAMPQQAPESRASSRDPQGKWVRSLKGLGAMSGARLGSLAALPGLPGRDLAGDPGVDGDLQCSHGHEGWGARDCTSWEASRPEDA